MSWLNYVYNRHAKVNRNVLTPYDLNKTYSDEHLG